MFQADALASFEQQFAALWPAELWRDTSVLVAVSGGPDSVALLRALAATKQRCGGPGGLVVGHFNHHLQPQADTDAGFVAGLANSFNLRFVLGEADVAKLAGQQRNGIEAAARSARYAFLRAAAERLGARYVATGHTADDQAETVLFNFLRGTGLAGLAGIPRVRMLGPAVSLIRPMLSIRRVEALSYLSEIKQEYRLDPTNAGADFARNRIRNTLLPLLRSEFNHDIDGAICRLSQLAGDAQRVIERLADDLLQRCSRHDRATNSVVVNTALLADTDRHLVRELFVALWRREHWPLQEMGFAEWDLLATMAESKPSAEAHRADSSALAKRCFPCGIIAERLHETIQLRRPG